MNAQAPPRTLPRRPAAPSSAPCAPLSSPPSSG